jgi:hypothetical protein
MLGAQKRQFHTGILALVDIAGLLSTAASKLC